MSEQAKPTPLPCGAETLPTGIDLLRDPALNKGTAFSDAERDALGLRGLLPPCVCSMQEQADRVLENFRRQPDALARYMDMAALQARNETLFYRVVMDNLDEMMPIIYTPTVGEACQKFGHIYQRPKGLFITERDRHNVAGVLRNWPCTDVRIIVVTDGERILGLGDLGANGMGIPVGKLALYTACAGVQPSQCLPVTLDLGTENEELLADALYSGEKQRRLRDAAYDEMIDEFVDAVQTVFPKALIQFEDFANRNAFRLLDKYRDRVCTFNDDIQGTGGVALAGLFAATRITGTAFRDQNFLFQGAGEAGIGIAKLIVAALVADGMPEDEARRRCWFVDSRGLVIESRTDLTEHKREFAHAHPPAGDLEAAVRALRPQVIIGVSGQPGSFTRAVVEAMGDFNERPVVMALSNPTSKAECTAEQAYTWSAGRAVFASGSPFAPVTLDDGRTLVPGQGNNAYVFPGVGLGVIASEATRVTDEMFSIAARTLATQVTESDLAQGRVYPPLQDIRRVSLAIAVAVAENAYARGLAGHPRPQDLEAHIRAHIYEPEYRSYV